MEIYGNWHVNLKLMAISSSLLFFIHPSYPSFLSFNSLLSLFFSLNCEFFKLDSQYKMSLGGRALFDGLRHDVILVRDGDSILRNEVAYCIKSKRYPLSWALYTIIWTIYFPLYFSIYLWIQGYLLIWQILKSFETLKKFNDFLLSHEIQKLSGTWVITLGSYDYKWLNPYHLSSFGTDNAQNINRIKRNKQYWSKTRRKKIMGG